MREHEMQPLVIDSSVYVSYFGHDANTPHTKQFWRTLATISPQIIIPSLVVAETFVTLAKERVPYLDLVYRYFTSTIFIPIDQPLIDHLYEFITALASPSQLKTSDLLIALIAKLHSATLVTWDRRLLTNAVCQVLTPTRYLASL